VPGSSAAGCSDVVGQAAPPGVACQVTWDDRFVGYGVRGRRASIRELSELRRRLAAAQDVLAGTGVTVEQAEAAFEAASERFAEAERAVDTARAERAQARQDRYAARQAQQRAGAAVQRLERRVRDLTDRLGGAPTLVPSASEVTAFPNLAHMF